MSNIKIRAAGLVLSAAVMSSGMTAFAEEIVVQDTMDLGEYIPEVPVEIVTDSSQITELVTDNWNEEFFGEITLSVEQEQAQKDGEDISLTDELNLTAKEENILMQSPEDAEQFINEQTQYSASIDEEDIVHIKDQYQTCRLIVYADELGSTFGAERVLYDESAGKYTLQFADREATEAADIALTAALGDENCNPDEMVTAAMLSMESGVKTAAKSWSWGTEYMGLDSLKAQYDDTSLDGSEVTVAVIDTGINKNHNMFDGRKISGKSFCGKNLFSTSFSSSNYKDYNGHGSHVAGIVADGTPESVNIIALRVFGYYNDEMATMDSMIIEAMEYAYEKGADVINMSFGEKYDKNNPQTKYNTMIKRLYDDGCAMSVAAGNLTSDNRARTVNYPAVLGDVFAVSALNSFGEFDDDYSCYGGTVDFSAPGTDIRSASSTSNSKHVLNSGTSMAAPHIAAAAAYVKMFNPDCSVKKVRSVLKSYSEDLGAEGKDPLYGYGAVKVGDYYADEAEKGNMLMAKAATEKTRLEYTGKPRINAVNVMLCNGRGETVRLDENDYTVSYADNIEIGTATAYISGIGKYTGMLECKYPIIPQKVELVKLTNPSASKMNVYWNKVRKGHGYEVKYSTNEDMSSYKKVRVSSRKTEKCTITGLKKGRTYFVTIRAYKNINGEKVWGRWNTVSSKYIAK